MARSNHAGGRRSFGQIQDLDRLLLAGQVLAAVMLIVLLPQGVSRALPLYALLGLTILLLLLQCIRLVILRRQPGLGGPTLAQQVCQLLTETADPATAVFHAVRAIQQQTGVGRVAVFATDEQGRYAELLSEARRASA